MDMMKLAQMAQEIMESGFDAKKDTIDNYADLPDGVYDAILVQADWRASDSGFEWLSLEFDILTPGFENRKYFGMHSFTNPDFLERNIKHVMQSAAALGLQFNPTMLLNPEVELVNLFRTGIGQQVDLKLVGWENKKTGKKGQNFNIGEAGTL